MYDLIEKLAKMIDVLVSKKCVCVCDEELVDLEKQLKEIRDKLNEWLIKAGVGAIGAEESA